jgi:hypothetical protein
MVIPMKKAQPGKLALTEPAGRQSRDRAMVMSVPGALRTMAEDWTEADQAPDAFKNHR